MNFSCVSDSQTVNFQYGKLATPNVSLLNIILLFLCAVVRSVAPKAVRPFSHAAAPSADVVIPELVSTLEWVLDSPPNVHQFDEPPVSVLMCKIRLICYIFTYWGFGSARFFFSITPNLYAVLLLDHRLLWRLSTWRICTWRTTKRCISIIISMFRVAPVHCKITSGAGNLR